MLLAMLAGRGSGGGGRRLYRVGLDYLWLTFALTYLGRMFDHPDRRAAGVFALVLIAGAGAVRLLAASRRA